MKLRDLSLFALALLVLCAAPLFAAEPPAPGGGDATVTPSEPVETVAAGDGDEGNAAGDEVGLRVVCALRFDGSEEARDCPDASDRDAVYLGDRLSVRVAGLDSWLEEEEKETSDLRLFLDGVEITDLSPEASQAVEGEEGTSDVRFRLRRDADNRDAWRTLLGPFQLRARSMSAGVGLDGEQEIAGSSSARIDLQAVHIGWFKFYVVLLVAVVVLFFTFRWKGRKLTDSLRDAQAEGTPKPYSLARCQMAWWFFLVIAAYVFLWLVLGDLDTITGSVLTLMGIGSGTALGAAMIDGSKKAEEQRVEADVEAAQANVLATTRADHRDQLVAARASLASAQVEAAQADAGQRADKVVARKQAEAAARAALEKAMASAAPADQARMAAAQAKLENVEGAVKQGSKGVLADLLSDGNGYSFHRFQIFVWTLVLGTIFVVSVLHELAMPQFSETLLGLMGISSGTYLGFKFPERFENGGNGGGGGDDGDGD